MGPKLFLIEDMVRRRGKYFVSTEIKSGSKIIKSNHYKESAAKNNANKGDTIWHQVDEWEDEEPITIKFEKVK